MVLHRRYWSVLLFVLSIVLSAWSQTVPMPQGNNSGPPIVATDQEQVVNYWTIEGGWHSEVQLRNNMAGEILIVTPVLRSANGDEATLPPVSIKPDEVKTVDIREAIESSSPGFAAYGSLVLRYHSPSFHNLYAAMMVHDTGHPIAFHIDAIGHIESFEGATREGIWWLPNDVAKDIFILTNQGTKPLDLEMSIYDAQGKEAKKHFDLGPRQMARYSIREFVKAGGLTGNYGGLQIRAAAHAGSLDTFHAIYDEVAGFSALLKMFDHDPKAQMQERDFARTSTWILRAPMLALSNPDPALKFPDGTVLQPQLFIRNTTGRTLVASLRFNWRKDDVTGKSVGPKLILLPHETRRLDVSTLQNGTTLPKDAYWTAVILSTNAQPDEIMAVAASYDQTLRYGAQTPFSDQLSFQWEGGQWEYDSMHDSIITAGNGGTKPTKAAFTLFYNQGAEKYELEQTLQPDEQMWIDIGKLIRERVPDKTGKLLPEDLQVGSYQFRDMTDIAVGSLFEGKVIYDKTYGHVSYGCAACCAYSGAWLLYNPFYNPIGLGFTNGVGSQSDCQNTPSDVSGYFYNWNTANHSIATTSSYGQHTGIAVGGTTSSTFGYLVHTNGRSGCYEVTSSASGPTDILNATISLADITQNKITVVLSSTAGSTGSLRLEVKGPSAVQTINTGISALGSGTYNYDFGLSTIPIGEYTTVTATWTVGGSGITANASDHFKILGTYAQTQYNTPAESSCVGAPLEITTWNPNPSCVGAHAYVKSDFDFRVTNPAGGTGSGHSINLGDVYQEQLCSRGSGDLRPHVTISGSLGGLSNSTVAVCQTDPIYQAGLRLYIVNEGIKTVTDGCVACCRDHAHLDNYTTDPACNGVSSLPNALTIQLY